MVNTFHSLLGQESRAITRPTAGVLGMHLTRCLTNQRTLGLACVSAAEDRCSWEIAEVILAAAEKESPSVVAWVPVRCWLTNVVDCVHLSNAADTRQMIRMMAAGDKVEG